MCTSQAVDENPVAYFNGSVNKLPKRLSESKNTRIRTVATWLPKADVELEILDLASSLMVIRYVIGAIYYACDAKLFESL